MRLLFTGRVVRASREARSLPIKPRRWNSTGTEAASSTESQSQSQSSPQLRVRRVAHGYNTPPHQIKDIHPQNRRSDTTDHSFSAFLHSKQESNKIIARGTDSGVVIASSSYKLDDTSNLSPAILKLLDRRLAFQPNHPISITRSLVQSVFPPPMHQVYHASKPVVSTAANFDILGFPADHPGRSTTDTYHVNKDYILRTHTSAHQFDAFKAMKGIGAPPGYTICADVFRRDSIDRSHFPVFHQMEGARLWRLPGTDLQGLPMSMFQSRNRRLDILSQAVKELGRSPVNAQDLSPTFHDQTNPKQPDHDPQEVRLVATHLKRSLEHLVAKVFARAKQARIASGHLKPDVAEEPIQVRWVEAYFPFTTPSWELEVFWQGAWLELLGCGIVQQSILENAQLTNRIGWAWGLGVERLAMLLFDIPDIRLFWSEDPRFLNQFRDGTITGFEPFSKFPACYKDVAFWIDPSSPASASPVITDSPSPSGVAAAAGGDATKAPSASAQPPAFHENDVMEIVRDVAGSLAEDVTLVDEFVHPTSGRKSLCYRVNYRSLERTLTNEETNRLHEEVGRRLVGDLGVELR